MKQLRKEGLVRDLAVLVATGISSTGKCEILGVSIYKYKWRTPSVLQTQMVLRSVGDYPMKNCYICGEQSI
jgi:hypothetical protein